MNSSMLTSDRAIHLKIAITGLIAVLLIAVIGVLL